MKNQKYDFFKREKISFAELDDEIKIEIAVLGGLDIFTDAHIQGVVEITAQICKAMNYSYKKTKELVLCAYLHDVGKIHIPSEILQKDGKLTDDEYEIMKKHTEYGYEICSSYNEFRHLAPIIRAHHENLDGTGYPDGLKENQIPEQAKLLKVADVYDALTRKRQYKEQMTDSQAIEIMINEVKTHKMEGKYLYYLIESVLETSETKLEEIESHKEKTKNEIETLSELEEIYKQIYDTTLTRKLEKKLERYSLEPGYDMSINANLLINKKKLLEKIQNEETQTLEERKRLKKQQKELKKYC